MHLSIDTQSETVINISGKRSVDLQAVNSLGGSYAPDYNNAVVHTHSHSAPPSPAPVQAVMTSSPPQLIPSECNYLYIHSVQPFNIMHDFIYTSLHQLYRRYTAKMR